MPAATTREKQHAFAHLPKARSFQYRVERLGREGGADWVLIGNRKMQCCRQT
jgi:hypothetical protein